ncbi:MAG: DUF1611 domain-containing protein [Planctomycetota bacterium]
MPARVDATAKFLLFLGDAQEAGMIKTAIGVARFRPERCVGEFMLDTAASDLTAGLDRISLQEGLQRGATHLLVGLATSGGALAETWIPALVEAVEHGYHLVSGMHRPLTSSSALVEAANKHDRQLIDVRTPPEDLEVGTGKPRPGRRLLTVGTDCAVGKMFTALRLEAEFQRRGIQATFRATGQTGILIQGDGIAVDAVVADFVSGATERLSPPNDDDHWDLIEGQGSLLHPSFAAVTLGLVHGAAPDCMVLCHDPRRSKMRGKVDHAVPSLRAAIEAHEAAARLTNEHARVVACSVITAGMDEAEREHVLAQATEASGLPAFDSAFDEGASGLVNAVLRNDADRRKTARSGAVEC